MDLIDKVFPSLKNSFLVSFLLGTGMSCLYASDFMDPESTLNSPSLQPTQRMNVPLDDDNKTNDSVISGSYSDQYQEGYLCFFPKDVWTVIYFHLPYKSRLALCASKKDFSVEGRKIHMASDLRRLEMQNWQDGPEAGSFDNYLFNNVLWTMRSCYLENSTVVSKNPLACVRAFNGQRLFLQSHFGQSRELIGIVVDTLINANSDNNPKAQLLRQKVMGQLGTPEENHLKIIAYIKKESQKLNVHDPISKITPSDLLERFHRTRTLRFQIQRGFTDKGEKLSDKELVALWEEVLNTL